MPATQAMPTFLLRLPASTLPAFRGFQIGASSTATSACASTLIHSVINARSLISATRRCIRAWKPNRAWVRSRLAYSLEQDITEGIVM